MPTGINPQQLRQQLVKNLLFVLVVNLFVKTIWIFFIDRNVQIKTGYEDYGTYQALFNLGIIFQILLDFGLTQYNSREIAQDPRRIRLIFSSMFWTRLIFILMYVLAVTAIGYLMGYSGWKIALLLGVLLIQAMNAMLLFIRSNVSALHHFRVDGVLAVIDRLLMILVCGTLLLLPATRSVFRIEWFVWGQVACYFVAVLVAFAVLFRLTPVDIHFAFRPRTIRKIVRESLPYASLIFMMAVYSRVDMVLVERLCGQDGALQAGIYASAFRLLDVANILGIMFSGILLPTYSRMLARNEPVAALVRSSVNMMMPVAFITAAAAAFFADDLMQLLYHSGRSGDDALIFTLLIASFPAYCIMYIYCTLLTAHGNLKLLNRIAVVLVVFNLGVNSYLIPHYQATGAAVTALCTEWLAAGAFIIYAHKMLRLPHSPRWVLSHLLYIVVLIVLVSGISLLPLPWQARLGLFVVAAVLLLFPFRFWTLASFGELLKGKHEAKD